MSTINLKKGVWTENDFEQMEWHDNKIYAIAFGIKPFEIMFDIDYILEWIDPKENEISYQFLVVPATLVFRNVYNLCINFSLVDVEIETIYRDNPALPKNAAYINEQIEYDWTIQTTNGEITFKSVGYKQYARQEPKLSNSQTIEIVQRGKVSFDISLVAE